MSDRTWRLFESLFAVRSLGIVEGLTEFLPVSSTAHLRIAEALMHIPLDDAYWKMYTIVIQLGAILALLLLFLSRIVDFIRTFPARRKRRPHLAQPSHLPHAHRLCRAPRCPPWRCTNGARRTSAASTPWPWPCSSAASSCGSSIPGPTAAIPPPPTSSR